LANKFRLLLVEDEIDILNVIKRGLENHGFKVDAFTDPSRALAGVWAGMHDLLILDIRMPGMSGIQLFKEIKNIGPSVKALFLTAFEVHEKEWHMVLPHSEVNGFIKKPVHIEHLVNAIDQIKASQAH